MSELKKQQQLSGVTIHVRKKPDGWKVFIPGLGIPFEPDATGEGKSPSDALRELAAKLDHVPQ